MNKTYIVYFSKKIYLSNGKGGSDLTGRTDYMTTVVAPSKEVAKYKARQHFKDKLPKGARYKIDKVFIKE